MSESTGSVVECPVCGEEFDPTDAGGWCTNSECGEWQYIGEEVPEPTPETGAEETGDDETDTEKTGTQGASADGTDSEGARPNLTRGANDSKGSADAGGSNGGAGSESVTGDDGSDDPDPTPAIRQVDGATAPEAESAADEAANVAEPTGDDESPDGEAAPDGDETSETQGAAGAGEACPECGTEIDPDDNFCASCGADLDDVGEPATLAECPACGTAVEADTSFCASCGEDLEAARAALDAAANAGVTEDAGDAATAESSDSLVLSVRGEEIAVAPDETVGREVRRVLTQTGAEEDQAVRIHREHIRFVREAGQFYVVDLGDNPTRLNGTRLSKGDREPIDPGDEIELSGVATLSVESA